MAEDRPRDPRIAELERELAALRAFESAPYRAVVEDMTELVVRWRPDGTRVFVNDAYCRLFGATREELVGSTFWPLITEEDRDAVRARLARLTPESPVVVGRHRAHGQAGEIWMEWSDRALFDASGEIVELQSVGRDITERVRVEHELRRIEQADAVARHSAAIAHDLAGMLQVVTTSLHLLRTRPGTPEPLAIADAAAQRGLELLAQLKTSTYGRPLGSVPLDVGERVTSALAVLQELAGENVRIDARLGAARCLVLGDPTQLDQVLVNLVRNGSESMPRGGTITIATDVVPWSSLSAAHTIPEGAEGRASVLRVTDEGEGIPIAILPRIFDARVTTKPSGDGLGLATVRAIVTAHRGSIAIETSAGGTRVEVAFPFAAA